QLGFGFEIVIVQVIASPSPYDGWSEATVRLTTGAQTAASVGLPDWAGVWLEETSEPLVSTRPSAVPGGTAARQPTVALAPAGLSCWTTDSAGAKAAWAASVSEYICAAFTADP